jgi:hypothetical protein
MASGLGSVNFSVGLRTEAVIDVWDGIELQECRRKRRKKIGGRMKFIGEETQHNYAKKVFSRREWEKRKVF